MSSDLETNATRTNGGQNVISRAPRFDQRTRSAVRWVMALAAIALIVLSVGIMVTRRFGSIDNGIRFVRGDRLNVAPLRLDLGAVPEGKIANRSIAVMNMSKSPVTLLDATSTCSCVSTSGFPLLVNAQETLTLSFAITLLEGRKELNEHIIITTDATSQPYLFISVAAVAEDGH